MMSLMTLAAGNDSNSASVRFQMTCIGVFVR